jgi:hypothetical protein
MPSLPPRARGAFFAGVLAVISFGGGGLATTLDHPVGDLTRPELTARGDAIVRARLGSARAAAARAQGELDELTAAARGVLAGLATLDAMSAREAIETGDATMAGLEAGRVALRGASREIVSGIDIARVGERDRARLRSLGEAVDALSTVGAAWGSMTGAAAAGIGLLERLRTHDRLTFEAIEAGRAEDFPAALERLDLAVRELAAAQGIRDALDDEVDVTTLDGWLARAGDYDAALRRLYALLRDSDGTVTDEVRVATAAVERAQAALPSDAGALVVIVSDVASARVTDGIVLIERARGSLAAAITALD